MKGIWRTLHSRIGLGFGLIGLLSVWVLRSAPKPRPGGLVVTFAGWTNDASGGRLALFDVANALARRIQFGVGEAQWRGTNGWPSPSMLGAGTGDWLSVEAGSHRVFSVPAPSAVGEQTWRVPLIYEEDPPPLIAFLDRIDGVDFGGHHWRLRARRKHRTAFVVGPEMTALSDRNQPVQGTGAGLLTQESNRPSSVVDFRR